MSGNKPKILYMGIDPSYTCTGVVALTQSYKVFIASTIKIRPGPARMLRAGKALDMCIRGTGTSQTGRLSLRVVIEDAAYGAPSRIVVAKLKELVGVYKFILEAHHVEWLEISPTKMKNLIAGKGNAEKHVVAQELKHQYGISFQNDKGFDLSDAAGLAVCGIREWGVKSK